MNKWHGIIRKAYDVGHYQVSIEQKGPNEFQIKSTTPPLIFTFHARTLHRAKRMAREKIGNLGTGNMKWKQVGFEMVKKG